MKMKFLALACATAMSFMASAYVTNIWQNASGGSWGEPSNWSLSRVPTSDDWVELPSLEGNYTINVAGDYQVRCVRLEKTGAQTVTLTGAGSVTSGINDCYVRENRALILDGPSFIMTKANFMLYGPVTVKSGSVLNCVMATMWLTAPALHVESGGSAIFSSTVNVRASTSVIDVNGGTFESPKITRSGGYTNCGSIRVSNDGLLVVQTLDLDNGSSVSVSSGSFSVSSAITMNGTVGLSLTGGTLMLPEGKVPQAFIEAIDGASVEYVTPTQFVDGPVTTRSVLESLGGDSLVVASDSDTAVHLFSSNAQLDDAIEVDGALYVTNGCINFNRRGFMGGDYPVFVKAFRIGAEYGVPTLSFPTIVIGSDYPFLTTRTDYNTFFLEGPSEIRPVADTAAPISDSLAMASGDFVVDTRDYNDPSVVRTMTLKGFGAKDAATLTVRGGGELKFLQSRSASPFSRFAVEEGTTLTLVPHLTMTTLYGPVHADEFVLGANTVLNIPAGSNAVHAAKWDIDPTAIINVVFEEGVPIDAKAVLCDIGGGLAIPDSQIRLIGATEGWCLMQSGGSWAVTNVAMDVSCESDYEWVGEGSDKQSANPDNWYGKMRPLQTYPYVFGAMDAGATVYWYRFFQGEDAQQYPTAKGATSKSIRFRNNAVPSFTIYGQGRITFSNNGNYENAAISSFSPVPQFYTYNGIRGNSPSFCAATEGPIVMLTTNSDFEKTSAAGVFRICGDVRFGALVTFPQFNFYDRDNGYGHLTCGSQFTVLSGGNVTFTNQTLALFSPYSGFRVKDGGSLAFNGGGSALYSWNSSGSNWDVIGCCAKNTIDGAMNINVRFFGGCDQAFGGAGTLSIASMQPSRNSRLYAAPANYGRSRISFGDTLTVHPPSHWTTVASGADYPMVIKAYGMPTIRTDGDWTYGPEAGFDSVVDSKWRAAEVCKTAVLTVDPSGGTATFADPVGGKGTLAITNGVLRVRGGTAETLGLVVKANGVFEPVSGQTLRSVRCENGGVLRLAAFEPVTVKESVNLGEINLAWPANLSLAGSPRWRTVLVSKTGFTGEFASTSQPCVSRVVETEGGFALQLRRVDGIVISFR